MPGDRFRRRQAMRDKVNARHATLHPLKVIQSGDEGERRMNKVRKVWAAVVMAVVGFVGWWQEGAHAAQDVCPPQQICVGTWGVDMSRDDLNHQNPMRLLPLDWGMIPVSSTSATAVISPRRVFPLSNGNQLVVVRGSSDTSVMLTLMLSGYMDDDG